MAFNPNIPAYSTQGKSFSRTAAFPLEGYEIWTDLEALKAYAANTDPAKDPSYIGQKIAYIDTVNNKVVHYGIEIDGSIRELGPVFGAEDEGKFLTVIKVVDQEASGEEGAEDYQPEVSHFEYDWVEIEVENTVTTLASSDNSVTITDTGADGNHVYDLKVNFPEITVPEYAIRAEERAEDATTTTYHLIKDGEDVDVEIVVPDDVSGKVATLEEKVDTGDQTVSAYVAAQIANAEIGKLTKIIIESVTEDGKVVIDGTTTEPAEHVIYMLRVENATGDAYKEYMVINGALVQIGDTTTDLSNYYNKNEVNALIPGTDAFGVLSVDTENTGAIEVKTTESKDQDYIVNLVLASGDKAGNVLLEDTADGLKASVAIPDLVIAESEALEFGEGQLVPNTIAVIAALEETADHELTPKTIEVATKQGFDALAALVGTPADDQGNVADGLFADIAKLNQDLAAIDTVNQLTYTYSNGEWSAATEVQSTIEAVLVEANVVKDENNTPISGTAGLMTPEEKYKLSALEIGDSGIEISGSVNADNVKGLDTKVINIVTGTAEGQLGIEKNAQVNKIEEIGLPDAVLAISTDKKVNIPAFVDGKYGVIKGAELVDGAHVVNKVYANEGVGEVKAVSTDILKNGAEEFILNGGSANV